MLTQTQLDRAEILARGYVAEFARMGSLDRLAFLDRLHGTCRHGRMEAKYTALLALAAVTS